MTKVDRRWRGAPVTRRPQCAAGAEPAGGSGCAASTALAPLLDGSPRVLHVVHRSHSAWQLADASSRVVASLVAPSAVRLPNSGVVASLPSSDGPVVVGAGSWCVGGARFRVTRWWSPPRPCLPALAPLIDSREAADLVSDWRAHLGQGDGLTPYADDVVCGALVAMVAARHRWARQLATAVVDADLEVATTGTSASLLRAAADGYCIDQVAAYLSARAGLAQSGRPECIDHVVRSLADLERVGHSSGKGLLEGIHLLLGAPQLAGRRAAA